MQAAADTKLANLDEARPTIEEYDMLVVGAPVYTGKFSPKLIAWLKDSKGLLATKPTAFFSVSLNAADARPKARIDDERLIREFLEASHLRPEVTASLAGSVHYPKYNFFIRWIMKRISAAANGPVDTSKEHEMTDWGKVDKFADDVLSRLVKNSGAQ